MTGMTLLAEVNLSPESASLPFLRRWVEAVWARACPGANPEGRHRFVLAVHEAFRNVIEHGYKDQSGLIAIEVSRSGEALVLRLTHDGVPFDGKAAPANFDGSRERGLGIYLMTSGLTRVAYRTTPEGRQQVELRKTIERLAPTENPEESQ